MSHLQHTIKAMIIEGDESGYVGSCFGLPVVTQGATLDEVVLNLREAVTLHFEGEDAAAMGYVDDPALLSRISSAG
jgi:predicted RNase H-like HicB family nuclease